MLNFCAKVRIFFVTQKLFHPTLLINFFDNYLYKKIPYNACVFNKLVIPLPKN